LLQNYSPTLSPHWAGKGVFSLQDGLWPEREREREREIRKVSVIDMGRERERE